MSRKRINLNLSSCEKNDDLLKNLFPHVQVVDGSKYVEGTFVPNLNFPQSEKDLVGGEFLKNPLTNTPFTENYLNLFRVRANLPVFNKKSVFFEYLNSYQVIVLEGETGSGKTTQIPQWCVEYCAVTQQNKIVCCTQPRRVAAMSVAQRVAEEMDVVLGKQVGYSIRFEECTDVNSTVLKYLTDGMLMREIMNDRLLSRYQVVVIDEAHERTTSTDILLGIIKELLRVRKDLKLVVMSATLDAGKFRSYFNEENVCSPLLKVSGRTFPVQVYYTQQPKKNYVDAAIDTVVHIHKTETSSGDILVFLTGQEEIDSACKKLNQLSSEWSSEMSKENLGELKVIPLYSTLQPALQRRIFEPPPETVTIKNKDNDIEVTKIGRKVIVATNIAETSLTIDGVVYVVDPGFSKQKVYNPKLKMECLLVAPISQASAKQRAGRAGRTKPGKCFRLYTEDAFNNSLLPDTYPEILRSNLSSVVLHMKRAGVDNLVTFDFIDPPAPETMMRAIEQLYELNAMDEEGELTKMGQLMSEFPVDPQQARCILAAIELNCSSEILSIVSMLSVNFQQIFTVSFSQKKNNNDGGSSSSRDELNQIMSKFVHPNGDHLTLLNIYNAYIMNKKDENFMRENKISHRTMQNVENVRNQLVRIMQKYSLPVTQADTTQTNVYYNNIRKALVAGFFAQVAYKSAEGNNYITMKDNQSVVLHPSVNLYEKFEWVLFNEFVLTSKKYIRTVSSIQGEWLMELAPHYFALEEFDGEVLAALLKLQKKK